jgi:hypothetical protein
VNSATCQRKNTNIERNNKFGLEIMRTFSIVFPFFLISGMLVPLVFSDAIIVTLVYSQENGIEQGQHYFLKTLEVGLTGLWKWRI